MFCRKKCYNILKILSVFANNVLRGRDVAIHIERRIIMNVYVCVGSSCHLKGSYKIIELMKDAVEKNNLEDKVNIAAAFCLGKCTSGVTVKVDDEIICGVSPENFNDIFSEHVLKKLG